MPFRYITDPLFLACLALYAVNRFVLKHIWHTGFLHEHLNDLICIPFWVPIMLWIQRGVKLRPIPLRPQTHEVMIPLILWSFAFEVWLPATDYFSRYCTGDPDDLIAYTAGAAGAMLFWRWRYRDLPQEAS